MTRTPPGASATYANVDASVDPANAAAWMDRVAAMPAVAAYKEHMRSLLAPLDGPIIDIGCGLGDDVRALGTRAVGVDPSRTMLATARERGGAFVAGAVEALPVRARSCAGARADRVLQHLRSPSTAIAAMVGAVRRGGIVVVSDPDQHSLVIAGPDPVLTEAIADFRVKGIRNGFVCGETPGYLTACDVEGVEQARWTLDLRDPADAFGLPTWSRFLLDAGAFTEPQADRFDESLAAAAAAGTFSYRIDFVVTWGRVR